MNKTSQPMSIEVAIAGLNYHLAKVPAKHRSTAKVALELLCLESDETEYVIQLLKVVTVQSEIKKASHLSVIPVNSRAVTTTRGVTV
jgi:hypothetical protein